MPDGEGSSSINSDQPKWGYQMLSIHFATCEPFDGLIAHFATGRSTASQEVVASSDCDGGGGGGRARSVGRTAEGLSDSSSTLQCRRSMIWGFAALALLLVLAVLVACIMVRKDPRG